MSPCVVSAVVLMWLFACVGCDHRVWSAPPLGTCIDEPPPPAGLVQVTADGSFAVNGKAYVPRGVNSYPLLEHVGRGRLDAVDDILDQAVRLGRPLVRTPAFLDGGESPARIRDVDGTLREAGLVALDQVLARAAEHEVRLLLVLTNNWSDFGGAPFVVSMVAPGESLPKNAFWSDPRAIAAQLAYQRALAGRINTVNGRRYAEDPSIFAWELANEARCERELTPELCDEHTLVRWAEQMAQGLRDSKVRQPIAWGGSGYLGEQGEHLDGIAASGAVDILTIHLYEAHARPLFPLTRSEVALIRGEQALRERAAVARDFALPLLLEEVGFAPEAAVADRDAERARVLARWLDLAHSLGMGTMPWMIGERDRPDYDGYLIRESDELTFEVLACR